MKKWISALCTGLAGVLSLVFLAMPVFTINVNGRTDNASGWELLTDGNIKDLGFTATTWYRIFVWILVIIAIILIVACVFQVLSNLSIIKMPAIVNTVARYALIALAAVSILALIANFGFRAEYISEMGGKTILEQFNIKMSVGIALWFATIINVAAAICMNLLAKEE